MPIVSLSRVNLRESIGDLGDRYNIGVSSCCIANDEWHLEADVTNGRVGDVSLYRNKNANQKGADPDWQWYGAVPAANIKSYSLTTPPAPSALPKHESQAANPKEKARSGVSAAQ